LGLRYQEKNFLAKNDTLRARLSVFQNDVDDYIEQVIAPATTQFRNATEAQLRGIEFEGSYENAAWILAASGGFTRGENETLNQPLSDVPPAQATLSAIRKVDAWDMNFGYSTNMAAAQDRIPSGQPLITKTGGWMVHNLFMTWQPDDAKMNNMRVDFGVDNLFDNYYRRQLSFIPEEGRTIKMQVGWKF
jgi:hemoglobin/transferrin/lactoferrin receptor protein